MKKAYVVPVLVLLAAAAAVLVLICCDQKQPPTLHPLSEKTHQGLAAQSEIFRKGIVKVTDSVYCAIGYGLANSIMIEGSDALIVVDTMTTVEEGRAVLDAFRTVSHKPIKAVIYTHNHADHVFGAEAFMADNPAVYAHESTMPLLMRVAGEMRFIMGSRSTRMFGNLLVPADAVNSGIGPFLGVTPETTFGFVPPTESFLNMLELTVADVRMRLIHAPGETDDQIVVWLPEKRLLICGDNFYWAFPNLYTIRGTPFRSLRNWYRSLDMMRDLSPEHLVPCHTRPITGAAKIEGILRDYRDAIQFVHDQAIRAMNMGLVPDEMVEHIQLPQHLAAAPYLQPFYGKVSWSVRSMFAGNLGWFDGDSASLQPLSRAGRARLTARLAGGGIKALELAERIADEGEWQASLQITSDLLQLEPENRRIKELRVRALIALASSEENPNARHYYMTEAMELQKGFVARVEPKAASKNLVPLPLSGFIETLVTHLDPKASEDVDQMVGLLFPGAGEAFTIHVRRGVAEVRRRDPDLVRSMPLDIRVVADAQLFKEMLVGLRSPLITIPRFDYDPGNSVAFGRFMKMFAPSAMKVPAMPFRG
ncbi:MAG: MBL fold metallo-hydrolase [Desulfobacteraceae bacterium]|nr:MAG: MBL fold metallo-hydrolase [Desulfobacteraceae bacterium]